MILSTDTRLAVERRFLCGLLLYPRVIDGVTARHFIAAQHGVIFDAIREAYREFPWEHYRGNGYDDIAVEIVVNLIHRHITATTEALDTDETDYIRASRMVRVTAEYERYITHDLINQSVTADGQDDLIQQILECPRCGR